MKDALLAIAAVLFAVSRAASSSTQTTPLREFHAFVSYPDQPWLHHDAHEECPIWAANGECEINPGYMLESCVLSCVTLSPEAGAHAIELLGLDVHIAPIAESVEEQQDVDPDVTSYLEERIVANLLFNNPFWLMKTFECDGEEGADTARVRWRGRRGEPIQRFCEEKAGEDGFVARTFRPMDPLRNPMFKATVEFSFSCKRHDVAMTPRLSQCGQNAEEAAALRMVFLNAPEFTPVLVAACRNLAIDPGYAATTLDAVRAKLASSSWALELPTSDDDDGAPRGGINTATFHKLRVFGASRTLMRAQRRVVQEGPSGNKFEYSIRWLQAHRNAERFVRAHAATRAPMDADTIAEINRLLRPHIEDRGNLRAIRSPLKGELRSNMNTFLHHEHVEQELDRFVAWLADAFDGDSDALGDPLLLASQAYVYLMSVHPFGDANGRTVRLVVDYVLMRGGLPPAIWYASHQGALTAWHVAFRHGFDPRVLFQHVYDSVAAGVLLSLGLLRGEPGAIAQLAEVSQDQVFGGSTSYDRALGGQKRGANGSSNSTCRSFPGAEGVVDWEAYLGDEGRRFAERHMKQGDDW